MVDATANPCWDADYYPFGGSNIFGTINCQPQYRYTLMETEPTMSSDDEYAMYRYYSHRFARFMSPDPIMGNPSNPQSWNRYAYVINSPVNFIDPLGLSCEDLKDPTPCVVVVTGDPFQGGGFGGSGATSPFKPLLDTNADDRAGGAANNGKLTPAQCKAAQTLLAREQKYGTTIAAWQSAIGYGDGTVEPFNSTNTAPINSPVGPIKVDWYTDLQLAGPFGDPLLYPVAKLTWTGVRLATGAPITNSLPFQDPAESNAWLQSQNPFSTFSSIFTPQFMAQNCSGGGG
jgi:RHS repeat-associated protein